ncbi:vitelline membrane outer layer protein 1-like [Thamnophis elegans]|uniref:vitelline membrane outer layer protein 1-like n=1 Tax=Thamnophis elegans TaxID=35005 RepID=UPI0013782E2A|nr:vitelline membrane outer layer protein 1-like [Thamnophis elegans]
MDLSASTALLLTISCFLWNIESRPQSLQYSSLISVPNGGGWGDWGPSEFCDYGLAKGFSLKVEYEQTVGDNTALNGIRLYCNDGTILESKVGPWGTWTPKKICIGGYLVSFSLRVEGLRKHLDNSAANNIWFKCSHSNMTIMGSGHTRGKFGPWSERCPLNGICGMRTRVQDKQGIIGDDTGLNDVMFFCC